MINTDTRATSSFEDQANLLDSQSNHNVHSPLRDQSDSENQSQFLNRVQRVLNESNEVQPSKHQILLQAQIIQLQGKCNNLSLINQKLTNKINQMIQQENNGNSIQTSRVDESSYLGDISEIQNQFGEVQSILKAYREQLQGYQKLIQNQKDKYDKQISHLTEQISLKDKKINNLKSQLRKTINQTALVSKKNEELILQIQQINEYKYRELNQSFNKLDNSYDREFEQQLQKIIERLAAQLEYERNLKKKINEEVKRMSRQIEKQQRIIQNKNQIIYQLQLKLLNQSKNKSQGSSWLSKKNSQHYVNQRQQKQYFNNERYDIDKSKKISPKSKTLSDLSYELTTTIQLPLYISYLIIQTYQQNCQKGLNKIKMTQSNVQIENINQRKIKSINIVVLTNKEPKSIAKNQEEYFWSTFDLIETLIISLSLDHLVKVKKAMLDLSMGSRNRRKLGSFENLENSIQEYLNL